MTNTQLLKELIQSKGLKLSFIAEKLGITAKTLQFKMNNITAFTAPEIQIMCDILGITSLKLKDAVFFCH